MLLTDCMVTQDNERTTFEPLAAPTARVLKLYKKQNEPGAYDGDGGSTGQGDDAENRGKIDHHLRKGRAMV